MRFRGSEVKVVGQLMVDNIHFNKNDELPTSLTRHPIAGALRYGKSIPSRSFTSARQVGGVPASSPASDWTNLDDRHENDRSLFRRLAVLKCPLPHPLAAYRKG